MGTWKYKKGRGDEIGTKFVRLSLEMMESEAYKALSTNGAWVLTQMERKYIKENFKKGKKKLDKLTLTYKEVNYKFKSSDTFYKARREVFDYGFYEITEQGGKYRRSTKFERSLSWLSISFRMKEEKERKAQSERDKARFQEKQQHSEEYFPDAFLP